MRYWAVAVAAMVVGLMIAGSAGAKIVVNRSVHGVALGATQAQVRARLGRPDSSRGDGQGGVNWSYKKLKLVIDLEDVSLSGAGPRRVVALTTRSTKERLANGLGIGSTERALKSRIKGLMCDDSSGFCDVKITNTFHGVYETDFDLGRNGRVNEVALTWTPPVY
jgi:hypothetical protein